MLCAQLTPSPATFTEIQNFSDCAYYYNYPYPTRQFKLALSNGSLQPASFFSRIIGVRPLCCQEVSQSVQEINQSLDPLVIDSSFQKYMNIPKDDIVSQAGSILTFRPKLDPLLQSHPEIEGIIYMDKEGKILYNSNQKSMNYSYDFASDPLFMKAASVYKPVLSQLHQTLYTLGPPQESISLIRPVTYLISGEINAWLIVDIKAEHFRSLMNGTYESGDGQILLYHPASGNVISKQDLSGELHDDLERALHKGGAPNEELLFESEGEHFEVIAQEIAPTGWQMVLLTPFDAITQGIKESRLWSLLIAFLSMIAACFIAFPLISGLRRVEHQLYASKVKEKEKELLLLQAQINPHFLFNTLETIESLAMKRDGEAVRSVVQSVSRMMRYNAKSDHGWSTLRDEMAFVTHFLKIHRHRNGVEVACDWEVSPDLLDLPVMKLVIQPFIENALKYGWTPVMKADDFQLTVRIHRQETWLFFRIENTGNSIKDTDLEKINKMTRGEMDDDDPYFHQHTGISNVYQRLVFSYGDSVLMHFSKLPDQGTVVEFQIPFHT
ncbi:sensor histidine kinase [Paenibacillus sp. P36]|uniref:cache domain-containing sensor histidine kinase n=1 Tax=Paenibacillus sp. P36 TaxID=3342538 RepID=UPI0038B27A7C